ncbi:5-oxoprolinase subunit PxpB [Pedobacter faecalis]|uniref:5-oxoprolinase subunit PxpB n=1 Tax=Pedobacter faecalis TaxID=3041495 RepID=UPI00254BEB2A|nr:5-oxoprolinase subunit PxpB [Pedobacter sp. ELA7]
MADILKTARFYPLGDQAIVLSLGNTIDSQTYELIGRLSAYLEKNQQEGFAEFVPAFTSVTIFYNPLVISYDQAEYNLRSALGSIGGLGTATGARVVEIPVCYGGIYGPDLDIVASHTGLSEGEVVRLHQTSEYQVYMIGFAPGFPYLGGLDTSLATPRKDKPTTLVKAGSVGIAGKQTGIYSMDTPGGWQIIGRTPLRLFDPESKDPVLLKAGDRIRFFAIDEDEFAHYVSHGN